MTRRRFTAPPQSERCTDNVILRDESGAQCMHRTVKNGRCPQHPVSQKCPRCACKVGRTIKDGRWWCMKCGYLGFTDNDPGRGT
jgi:hypothetical protein